MGPAGPLGQITQYLGWGVLSFTFTGLLIGSLIFSLPFAVQPIQHAFESIGPRPLEAAVIFPAKQAWCPPKYTATLKQWNTARRTGWQPAW